MFTANRAQEYAKRAQGWRPGFAKTNFSDHADGRPMGLLIAGIGLGAAAVWLLDPRIGRQNRALLRDKFISSEKLVTRDLSEALQRKAEYTSGKLAGLGYEARKMAHLVEQQAPPDLDQYLKARIESEIFRDPTIPKGDINIDAAGGRVTVRGTVASTEMMNQILDSIDKVEGVREVVSLMKTPTPVPSMT